MNRDALRFPGALMVLALLGQPACGQVGPLDGTRRTGTLVTARAAHTATSLPTGQVLIVGGMVSGGGSLATAEMFDPARNRSEQTASLEEPRAGHTATLLADGRVLIAGGYNGEYLSSVEIFDASMQRFAPAGTLLEGRSGHTATLLSGGRILFIGGVGRGWTFLRSAELFDPATGRSQRVGMLSVPRESHTATLLSGDRVLVVGGHSGRRQQMQVYASAELYDPQTRGFVPAGSLATPRHKHDAVGLTGGRVLIIGGADRSDRVHYSTTEVYDVGSRSFSDGPAMAHRRYKIAGTTVMLANGDVLVTSGARSAELLPLDRLAFVAVPGQFPEAYYFAAAAPLPGGDVLIAGGYSDANRNTAGIWRFSRR
ncbi:MAG TPA: kelch repeat-containing protein [Longimicrobiales bacterium]|nr:kelch repeat-containing protein [Longimicrobiales bacterium]